MQTVVAAYPFFDIVRLSDRRNDVADIPMTNEGECFHLAPWGFVKNAAFFFGQCSERLNSTQAKMRRLWAPSGKGNFNRNSDSFRTVRRIRNSSQDGLLSIPLRATRRRWL